MTMQALDAVFYIVVLIMSIVIHEFAHGYMAHKLGDDTAHFQGRLTLNPIKHLDLFGSIILPLFLIITKAGFLIGWAKPVPYNPNNLKDKRKGTILVSIAGIMANVFIAIIFGLLIRYAYVFGLPAYNSFATDPFYKISITIVFLNIVLAIFNLIPIPPLDGSKILFALLPTRFSYIESFLEKWGVFVLIFFIIFLWSKVSPLIYIIFSLITGLH
jgi:Zn-dependent protease